MAEHENNYKNSPVPSVLTTGHSVKERRAYQRRPRITGEAATKSTRTATRSAKSAKSTVGDKGEMRAEKKPSAPRKTKNNRSASPLRIIPLGGLDEIGKNCTAYEYENDLLLVDCGMTFPDDDMPGVDIVIPDISFLVKNKDRLRGICITHGHEDHIGALPYLLKEVNIPVYGTSLTLGLVEGKLKEHGLAGQVQLNVIKPGNVIRLGRFTVEFIHVNHSIPDAVALAIQTPAGLVVQTGDFKIDATPIDGEIMDLCRLAELGKQGVLALLSDSTNADRPGFTMSERTVGDAFVPLFNRGEGKRIIVATFSSNIHRVQQIIDEAVRCNRKVAVSGRSMINVVTVAQELGYLKIPEGVLIDIDLIRRYSPGELVIITTGSQGEPMSALHRMAHGEHRKVTIGPEDMIIISANPIPGNEKTVSNVVNELMKLGADVIYEKMYDVHVSGHACQEELKIVLSMVRPTYFIPVHGEQKHLQKHASLAMQIGIDPKNIVIADNGQILELTANSIRKNGTVQAGRVLVDGLGVGDVGSIVLRDRKHLAEDGIIIVVMAIDGSTGEILSGPDIVSRGFVYVRESEALMEDAKHAVCDSLDRCYEIGVRDWNSIKTQVRDALSRFVYERTKRSPMILPIIMDV